MAARIRSHDWAATRLGPVEGWPQSLRSAVDIILGMPGPATILWGPGHVQIYNDAYIAIARDRHPRLLGRPIAEGWPEICRDLLTPLLQEVRAGRSTRLVGIVVSLRDAAGETVERSFDTDWSPLRDESGAVAGALQTLTDVSLHRQAEAALLANSERQFFLLALSDDMRPLTDPAEIKARACHRLGEHLRVDRAYYVAIDEAAGLASVERDYNAGQGVSLAGTHSTADFAWSMAILRRGECHAVADTQDSPLVPAAARPAFATRRIVACITAPLIKSGTLMGVLCVTEPHPRAWTASEVELLREVGERIWSATARAQVEVALRESEARLSAAFASVPAGVAIIDRTGAATTSNCEYRRFLPSGIIPSHDAPGALRWRAWDQAGQPIPPHDFPGARALRGERVVPGQEMLFTDEHGRETWTMVGTVPIVDAAGRVTGAVAVISDIDRQKRNTEALRASEARFQQFASSSSDALWIRDAATLTMEYVSPAIQTIYGVPPVALLGDLRQWAALVVPEDRALAMARVERARRGEAVTHEFRILRSSDGAVRWIRSTDFPLFGEHGGVQRIGGIAVDVTEARQAEAHRDVLMHELQHRVRNILAMTRSIADRTGDTARDVASYRDLLAGRLEVLSRVQVMLTQASNVGVDLGTMVEAEVEAQAASRGQYSVSGPALTLAPKAAEVLTLAIHELATNALKYGAFSHVHGHVAVSWSVADSAGEPWLRLDWIESGAPAPLAPPQRQGFGTILIEERIPYELQGRGLVAALPDGWRCHLEFPLRPGDSILQTDSVTTNPSITGGNPDVAGEPSLGGRKVLVVEDDFFLAKTTERALRRARGRVVGPVGQTEQALALLAQEAPHAAVVDINLGQGAEFAVAEALQEAGVPFVFVTGYNDVVIPSCFDGVERLRKPVDLREMVRSLARMGDS